MYDLSSRKVTQTVTPAEEPRAVIRRPADGSYWLLSVSGVLSRLNTTTLEMKPAGRCEKPINYPVGAGQELYGTRGGEFVRVTPAAGNGF